MNTETTTYRSRRRLFRLTNQTREAIEGYFFISPWFIGFLIFTAGPLLATVWYSLTEFRLNAPLAFVGLRNYTEMVQDPLFWHSLGVTVRYTLFSVTFRLIIALAVALLMIRPLRGIFMLRTIYYLPAVLGGVPIALLWMWVLKEDYGILNQILGLVGIKGPQWLTHPDWAPWTLVMMSAWNFGLPMVIFIAGLQGIPSHLYEAATIDGANWWKKLWYVTLPMLTPTLLFQLVMQIIVSFQVFDIAFVVSSGDGRPVRSTLVYLLYYYRQGFLHFRLGYASALALALMLITLVLTALIFKSSSLWVFYESEVRE
jgi:multiple sugar transport system permease protein